MHTSKYIIDYLAFLGMHHANESCRIACKNFMIQQAGNLYMSIDQIGNCDHIVWRMPRVEQDCYYAFMDHFHTHFPINRILLTEQRLVAKAAEFSSYTSNAIAFACAALLDMTFVSCDNGINIPPTVCSNVLLMQLGQADELFFQASLELDYQRSLSVRFNVKNGML